MDKSRGHGFFKILLEISFVCIISSKKSAKKQKIQGVPDFRGFFGGKRKPRKLKSAEIGDCFSTKTVKRGEKGFQSPLFNIFLANSAL